MAFSYQKLFFQSRKLQFPIFYGFNLPLPIYSEYGLSMYRDHEERFNECNIEEFKLMHNVVGLSQQIEERAAGFKKRFDQFMNETNAEKVHLVGHSFAGVDLQGMIKMYPEIHDKVCSLTTLSSPHKGLKLLEGRSQQFANEALFARALYGVGMSTKNYYEFTHENMKSFQGWAKLPNHIKGYSVGAVIGNKLCDMSLRYSHEVIMQMDPRFESDGLVYREDAEFGTYLVTTHQDHFHIGGLSHNNIRSPIYNLVCDNLTLHEIRMSQEESEHYGLQQFA